MIPCFVMSRTFGLPVSIFSLIACFLPAEPQQCDRNHIYSETLGLCYKIYTKSTNRLDAMAACEAEEAKLIIIENVIEFGHISNSLGNLDGLIGLQAVGAGREWKWWNGKTTDFVSWYPNQPDNYNGPQTYVTIYDGGFWDYYCDMITSFVCQKYT